MFFVNQTSPLTILNRLRIVHHLLKHQVFFWPILLTWTQWAYVSEALKKCLLVAKLFQDFHAPLEWNHESGHLHVHLSMQAKTSVLHQQTPILPLSMYRKITWAQPSRNPRDHQASLNTLHLQPNTRTVGTTHFRSIKWTNLGHKGSFFTTCHRNPVICTESLQN